MASAGAWLHSCRSLLFRACSASAARTQIVALVYLSSTGFLQTIHSLIFLARKGRTQDEIRAAITARYYQHLPSLEEIRPNYGFDASCQGSVPQAIAAFLEATSFEDTIRNAVSIGGDSDTIAAIAGSIAEPYFGIPESMRSAALAYLDKEQRSIVERFEALYGAKVLAS